MYAELTWNRNVRNTDKKPYDNKLGDARGSALEGLRNIYYNPEDYDVLPYRHNYT